MKVVELDRIEMWIWLRMRSHNNLVELNPGAFTPLVQLFRVGMNTGNKLDCRLNNCCLVCLESQVYSRWIHFSCDYYLNQPRKRTILWFILWIKKAFLCLFWRLLSCLCVLQNEGQWTNLEQVMVESDKNRTTFVIRISDGREPWSEFLYHYCLARLDLHYPLKGDHNVNLTSYGNTCSLPCWQLDRMQV